MAENTVFGARAPKQIGEFRKQLVDDRKAPFARRI